MRYILGLTAENSSIKTALLKEEKGVISLENVQSFLESDSFVKQLYTAIPLPEGKSFQTATALSPQDVLFRTLSLSIPDRKKALAALPFQLEGILPFAVEEALVCASLTQMGKEAQSISLFAAKNSSLQSHLEWTQSLQIDPDYVSCIPTALHRLCCWLLPKEKSFSIFHFGQTKSCCVVAQNDEILLTQTLHFGHLDFLQDLSSNSNHVKEMERLFCYLQSKNAITENTEWILLGNHHPTFFSSLGKTRNLDLAPNLHEYATTIGTALDALAEDKHSVQFLQGKWTPKRQQEQRKTWAVRFAGLCLAAALVVGLGGHLLLQKKKTALSEQLLSHLPASLSNSSPRSTDEWRELLWRWDSSLNEQKLPFPFLPTVASVSDVLAWLSSHPTLSTADGKRKEGIDIKAVRYQLYKHPKLGEAGGFYAARVDLEFSSTTPRLAREFHDALLKGDQIVDPKKEIKWNAQHDTYWTSFELRTGKRGTP